MIKFKYLALNTILMFFNFQLWGITTPLASPISEEKDILSLDTYQTPSKTQTLLIEKLKEVEEEARDPWKIVLLSNILSEQEQIAALDQAVLALIEETGNSELRKKLDDARITASKGEQLSKLNYLLESPKRLIEAYTQKAHEKIYVE